MANQKPDKRKLVHYFIDEAGDTNLFNRRGRVIIGSEGCSQYFLLGLLRVNNPNHLERELQTLRQQLLSDPYFKNVPSLQPENKKTALAFHAKDDLPEIRREVFSFLRNQRGQLHFSAVVKSKHQVLQYVRERELESSVYRYNPNELYDYLVGRLFRGRLHKPDECNICFAKRGSAPRTKALQVAIEAAYQSDASLLNVNKQSVTNITASIPAQSASLQAADYFNWALQRFYERREDRYLQYLWDMFSVVIDLDGKQGESPGTYYPVYYNKKRPMSAASIAEFTGID